MKYKILGNRKAIIGIGDGWPVSDPEADRYKGLIGKLVIDAGGTILLEFRCGSKQAFRPTSLVIVDDSLPVSNAPPNRYRSYKVIEIPCSLCGVAVEVEATEGAKRVRCGACVRDGKSLSRKQTVSDDELISLYFDQRLSFTEIAEALGKRFGERKLSATTVAHRMRQIVRGTELRLRTRSEAATIAKRRYPSRVKRHRMMISTKGKDDKNW